MIDIQTNWQPERTTSATGRLTRASMHSLRRHGSIQWTSRDRARAGKKSKQPFAPGLSVQPESKTLLRESISLKNIEIEKL
jgi:hypothetical protein